jgi:hypothetical protein
VSGFGPRDVALERGVASGDGVVGGRKGDTLYFTLSTSNWYSDTYW